MKNKIIIAFIFTLIIAVTAGSFVLAENDEENQNNEGFITPTALPVILNSALNKQATFSDSDQDGVVDTLDKYPGEDDFAYGITDNNKNGIVDALEYLATK